MKLLTYNIAYGTGPADRLHKHIWSFSRHLRTSHQHLEEITSFIDKLNPDIITLIEVDTGSFRTKYLNQAKFIAKSLSHEFISSVKYHKNSFHIKLPFFNNQSNAIFASRNLNFKKFHYFPVGMKRLIIEAEINNIAIFLVHLSLKKKIRANQLKYLAKIVAKNKLPKIITGDFNTFKGEKELIELCQTLNLSSANKKNQKTYPAWNPRYELDFFLHSKEITINKFTVPQVCFSDHMPILIDFNIN